MENTQIFEIADRLKTLQEQKKNLEEEIKVRKITTLKFSLLNV